MKWLAGALALLVVAGMLGLWWLLETEPGLQWAAARVQAAGDGKLELEGLHGALAREIRVERVGYVDGKTTINGHKAVLRLELLGFLGGRVGIRSLRMESLEADIAGDGERSSAPALPFGVRIDSAELARIEVHSGDQRVVVEDLRLRDAALREDGALAGWASFKLPEERYPVVAELRIGGTLERLELSVHGTVAAIPAAASVLLAPFAPRRLQAIEAQAGPIDLKALDPDWPGTALTVKLAGKPSDAAALAGTLEVRNAQPGPLDKQRLPAAVVDARFATDFVALSLHEMTIALAPAGTLAGQAELRAGRASFELRVAALDLRSLRSNLRKTALHGRVRGQADEKTQSIRGELAQAGMSLSADALRTGDTIEIRSLRATAEGGEATGSARLRLGEPMRFEAKLKLARFDPARFGDYPAGSLNGNLDATGTLGTDYRVDARWIVRDSTLLGAPFASRGAAHIAPRRLTQVDAGLQLGGANLNARGDFGRRGDELAWQLEVQQIAQFLDDAAGRLRASGRLRGTWDNPQGDLEAQALGLRLRDRIPLKAVAAKASGSLAQHDAQLSLQAEGLDLDARLRGRWNAGQWAGEIRSLRNSGAYPMQLTAPAPLEISRARVTLGRLEAKLAEGRLLVKEIAWSPEGFDTSGEFSALPAQWLILAAGAAERVRSTLLIDGDWSVSAAPRLTGTASMRRAAGDLTITGGTPMALGLEKAVLDARFENGRIKAKGAVTTRFASVALEGEVSPEPAAAGLGITAQSALAFGARVAFADLRALSRSMVSEARLDGRINAELRGSGTLASPALSGTVHGEAIALDVPPYGVYLKNGELRGELEGDRLRLTSFSIQGGEGRLTASGALPLRFSEGAARVAWQAERFGLLERPDLRLVVSGAGEAQLQDGKILLVGALRAERGYLELEQERLPRLGEDVVIIGQQRAPPKGSARVPVALDVQLDLGDELQVRGYGLEGKLTGRLQVATTKEGELRVYGRVQAVNATFFAYGERLQVDPGVAIFDGPLDNPSLQMTAWRRNQQVEAGVQLTGTARAPRLQLVSNPPVPEGERLSWLVLGRAPGNATKADLGMLQAAAGALLARGDQMPLDRRIARTFGLDEISLRGSGEAADRVVAVGKRLSDRLYISYEQGLGAAASALVKLDLSLTQRLSVRAETGTSSGVGLFYRFSWD
jgi:translocation and assembly module TamB